MNPCTTESTLQADNRGSSPGDRTSNLSILGSSQHLRTVTALPSRPLGHKLLLAWLVEKSDDSRTKRLCFYEFQGRISPVSKETLSASQNYRID